MQVLHPMQRRIRAAALRGSSGSQISARVMPTASAAPPETMSAAASGSTIRVVAISGGPTR